MLALSNNINHTLGNVRPSLRESRREPLATEPQRVALSEILVVCKESSLQYELRTLGVTYSQLLKRYEQQGKNAEKIVASHERQESQLKILSKILSPEQIVRRNDISWKSVNEAQAVIAYGGDNHFHFVAQYLENNFIIGVNSDPILSEGALTYNSAADLENIMNSLTRGEYLIEEWTRLEAQDSLGRKLRCSGDFFIGERERLHISRHLLGFAGQQEEQKGSGLIVTTGADSSAWYSSEGAYFFSSNPVFAKTDPKAAFLLTAPYIGNIIHPRLLNGEIGPGEKLQITSLNRTSGIIAADELVVLDLPYGTKISIGISEQPLKVLHI